MQRSDPPGRVVLRLRVIVTVRYGCRLVRIPMYNGEDGGGRALQGPAQASSWMLKKVGAVSKGDADEVRALRPG